MKSLNCVRKNKLIVELVISLLSNWCHFFSTYLFW